jgi:hypothetical protein
MLAIRDKNQYTNITSSLIDFLSFYINPYVNIVTSFYATNLKIFVAHDM